MITTVTYERLYNLGNYENEKISAVVVVEDGNAESAFAEAKAAVDNQHARLEAERTEEEKRRQEAYEAERQARNAAIKQRYQQDDDLAF